MNIDGLAQAVRDAGATGRRIALVGAGPNAGTTATAVALARVLSRNARVMLVDLSLDRPALASITADPHAPGVADLARGTASFGQVITRDRHSRVQVISAGRVGPDAPLVYRCERLALGIDALSQTYDHVIIDAGAAQSIVTDRLARFAPCAVLVAGEGGNANAAYDQLAAGGFTDVAVFTGRAPALDPDSIRGVAA